MKCFEYITLVLDPGDLYKLNSLGAIGWEISATKQVGIVLQLILKRELKGPDAARIISHYMQKERDNG